MIRVKVLTDVIDIISNLDVKGIIFDLDDTLYSEKEYVKSGFQEVARFLATFTSTEAEIYTQKLWSYFEEGKPALDVLLGKVNSVCHHNNLKERCLQIYRNQENPNIHLYEGVTAMLSKFKKSGFKLGIITDGRSEGQRNKIKALSLESLIDDIIITDELGGIQFRKPCDIAFRIIQMRWRLPAPEIVYIGDNMNKDFQAPKQLGMKVIHFQNKDGLYYD